MPRHYTAFGLQTRTFESKGSWSDQEDLKKCQICNYTTAGQLIALNNKKYCLCLRCVTTKSIKEIYNSDEIL